MTLQNNSRLHPVSNYRSKRRARTQSTEAKGIQIPTTDDPAIESSQQGRAKTARKREEKAAPILPFPEELALRRCSTRTTLVAEKRNHTYHKGQTRLVSG